MLTCDTLYSYFNGRKKGLEVKIATRTAPGKVTVDSGFPLFGSFEIVLISVVTWRLFQTAFVWLQAMSRCVLLLAVLGSLAIVTALDNGAKYAVALCHTPVVVSRARFDAADGSFELAAVQM